MIIDELIYDRTPEETEELAAINQLRWQDMTAGQQGTWLAGRGAFNYTDWNRIKDATAYLYTLLTGMGYEMPDYVALSAKTINGNLTEDNLRNLLASVSAIKSVLDYAMVELPTDITGGLSTDDANNIEKSLAATYTLAMLITQQQTYSGQTYSGQLYAQFGG